MIHFSHKYIKLGQIITLIISLFLMGINLIYLFYDFSPNTLLLCIVTFISLFLINFLLSRFYEIRIESHKIFVDNFYQRNKKYYSSDLKQVSIYSMAFGIYSLSFINGKSYLFTMGSTKQLRNLLILDKERLEKRLNTELDELLN